MARQCWAVTRPCQPISMDFLHSISRVRSPGSPTSSSSMEMFLSNSLAMAHILSTWDCSSSSVYSIQGMPPITSTPISAAWRTSSSVPGSRITPSWGKATTCSSTLPLNSSRAFSRAFTPSSRALESTSAKARMWVLPCFSAIRHTLRTFSIIHFSS